MVNSKLSPGDVERLVFAVENLEMRGILRFLFIQDCRCLVYGHIYGMGGIEYTLDELVAYCQAYATTDDRSPINGVLNVKAAITHYQKLVGVENRSKELSVKLGEASTTPGTALDGARTMASWVLAGLASDDAQRPILQERYAHILLRWATNVKRRLLGLDLKQQGFLLDIYGKHGSFKTALAKKLLEGLQPLVVTTSNLADVLVEHDGYFAAAYASIWVDEMPPVDKRHMAALKAFIHAERWRVDSIGQQAVELPMLASLICTHNGEPFSLFPDPAMERRVGLIRGPVALPRREQTAYAEKHIEPFDSLDWWRKVRTDVHEGTFEHLFDSQQELKPPDPVLDFIEECCIKEATSTAPLRDFFAALKSRAFEGGWDLRGITDRMVASQLRSAGYSVKSGHTSATIHGIRLRDG